MKVLILCAFFGLLFTIHGIYQRNVMMNCQMQSLETLTTRQIVNWCVAEVMWLPCLTLGAIIDAATVILSVLFFMG